MIVTDLHQDAQAERRGQLSWEMLPMFSVQGQQQGLAATESLQLHILRKKGRAISERQRLLPVAGKGGSGSPAQRTTKLNKQRPRC